jgi:hypothetical protein
VVCFLREETTISESGVEAKKVDTGEKSEITDIRQFSNRFSNYAKILPRKCLRDDRTGEYAPSLTPNGRRVVKL